MVSKWTEHLLGDVIELKRGFDLPQSQRRQGNIPIVSSSGVSGTHSEPRVAGPGVVTGRYGTLGQVFFVPGDFWPLNTTLFVSDFKGNDPKFVSYFLRTLDFLSYSDKAAVPGVNRNHLHTAKIFWPPDVEEQRAVAHILGTLDDKIELNRKMNQTLEAIAQAIFKSWFVDFDPVRAKASGESAQSICRRLGITAELLALFPARFQGSELGEIPEGWDVSEVGDVVTIVGGSTPSTKSSEYWDGGTIHWATPKDFSSLSSRVLLDTERKITDLGLRQISSGLLPPGTVLMSSRAPIGYLALSTIPISVNQGFIAMVCDGPISSYYMLHWCERNLDRIKQRAGGTTFAEISKGAFRPMPLAVPKKALLGQFDAIVKPIFTLVAERARESTTLVKLRDSLLPKLVSGELPLSSVEGKNL